MNYLLKTALVLSAPLLIAGCGGGSSSPSTNVATGIGYYVDSPVSGMDYQCGSQSGVTGENGSFTFEANAGCTFSLEDISFRDIPADMLADGKTIYEKNVERARVLQALDADHNPDNGIQISRELVDKLKDAAFTAISTIEASIEDLMDIIGVHVSKSDAMAHMLTTLMPEHTFYTSIDGEMGTLKEVTFSADMKSMTWHEMEGGSASGTFSVSIDGTEMKITTSGSGPTAEVETRTVIDINEDYILCDDDVRYYYDEAKAKAYYFK